MRTRGRSCTGCSVLHRTCGGVHGSVEHRAADPSDPLPARREAGVQRQVVDPLDVHPVDRQRLGRELRGVEGLGGPPDHRHVAPAAVVVDVLPDDPVALGPEPRLLRGLPRGGVHRGLAAVARTAEDPPGAAVVAPQRPVLQQHPIVVPQQQARGAVDPPVLVTLGAVRPAVTVAPGDHGVQPRQLAALMSTQLARRRWSTRGRPSTPGRPDGPGRDHARPTH